MRKTKVRMMAQQMLRDPYYKLLRNTVYGFGLGAKEAYQTVKEYDALMAGMKATAAKKKRCKVAA
jgi:hypothetical protein